MLNDNLSAWIEHLSAMGTDYWRRDQTVLILIQHSDTFLYILICYRTFLAYTTFLMIAAARDKNRYKSCCLVGNGNCFFLLQRQGTQLLISFSVWSRRRKKIGLEERKKVRKKHWCLLNLKCSIKKMAFLGYQYYAVTDIFTRPQGWIFSGVNIFQG